MMKQRCALITCAHPPPSKQNHDEYNPGPDDGYSLNPSPGLESAIHIPLILCLLQLPELLARGVRYAWIPRALPLSMRCYIHLVHLSASTCPQAAHVSFQILFY